jgi:hypothetical protein
MAIIGVNGYSGSGKDTVGVIVQYLNCPNVNELPIEEAVKNYKNYEEWLDENSGWEIRKFAGKLKDIASHLTGIDIEDFEDQEFKKTNLGTEWWTTCDEGHQPMTVRDFLQKLGTDALRNGLHPNVWVNALMADYKQNVDLNTYRYAKGYIENRESQQHEKKFPVSHYMDYLDEVPFPNWIVTDTRFTNEAEAIKKKGGIIIRIDKPGVKPINDHPSEVGLDGWKFDYKIYNNSDIFDLKQNVENILKHAKLL